MILKKNIATAAAIAALAILSIAPASAQSTKSIQVPALSFNSSGQRGMWQTVLLVSAVVGIVGVVQGDSTLTLLGGAGVLLSLYETNRMGFQARPLLHGVDVLRSGPVSFGLQPFGNQGFSAKNSSPRPGAYVQATFRF